jgi:hypothetical protein
MRDHSNHICGTRHEVVGALMQWWDFTREVEVELRWPYTLPPRMER